MSSARTGYSSGEKVTGRSWWQIPSNCVVFCRACAKTCGPDAIAFPEKSETLALIKRLREAQASSEKEADS